MKAQIKVKDKFMLIDISETLKYLYESKHITKISFISEIKKSFQLSADECIKIKEIKFLKLI